MQARMRSARFKYLRELLGGGQEARHRIAAVGQRFQQRRTRVRQQRLHVTERRQEDEDEVRTSMRNAHKTVKQSKAIKQHRTYFLSKLPQMRARNAFSLERRGTAHSASIGSAGLCEEQCNQN